MIDFEKLLSGGDLRSLGKSHFIIKKIRNQNDFDKLFEFLFHPNRIIVMRAADTLEKITALQPHYLHKHKEKIFELCSRAADKELMWHLAQFLPRLELNSAEINKARTILSRWAADKSNSRIVRVNSIQAFHDLSERYQYDMDNSLIHKLEKENIPSITARIKKLKKAKHT